MNVYFSTDSSVMVRMASSAGSPLAGADLQAALSECLHRSAVLSVRFAALHGLRGQRSCDHCNAAKRKSVAAIEEESIADGIKEAARRQSGRTGERISFREAHARSGRILLR